MSLPHSSLAKAQFSYMYAFPLLGLLNQSLQNLDLRHKTLFNDTFDEFDFLGTLVEFAGCGPLVCSLGATVLHS